MTYEDALAILRDGWPITPEDLTQIAADIWDDGYDAGGDDERAHLLGASLIDINQHTPNPYKRNEAA